MHVYTYISTLLFKGDDLGLLIGSLKYSTSEFSRWCLPEECDAIFTLKKNYFFRIARFLRTASILAVVLQITLFDLKMCLLPPSLCFVDQFFAAEKNKNFEKI